jgi:KDO2-lipid IV(A) lauroyltransferase
MVPYLLYVTAAKLIHVVHPRIAEAISDVIAFFFYTFRPRIRRNVGRNFEAIGIRGDEFAVFRHFSRTIRDFMRFMRLDGDRLARYFRITGKAHLDRAVGEGKGVIVITPHLGPWEIAGAYLASLGYRIHTVALPHPAERVTRFFSRVRRAWGITDYPLGDSITHLLRALHEGNVVVLLVDRNYLQRGIELTFFDRNVTVPDGHIVLAQRTGAALLPSSCYYNDDGTVDIRVEEAVSVDGSSGDPAEIGSRCLRRIERHIRAHPEQWFAFDHLWPES